MWSVQGPTACWGIAPAILNIMEEGLIPLIHLNLLPWPNTPIGHNRVRNPNWYLHPATLFLGRCLCTLARHAMTATIALHSHEGMCFRRVEA